MQVTVYKIYEFLGSPEFQREVETALREAGVISVAILKDDARVERAALLIYDNMPVYMRAVIGVTLGKKGFVTFVFKIRDKLIEHDRLDLSWLDLEQIKIIIIGQIKAQDFSDYIWTFSGTIMDGRPIVFDFRGPAKQTPEIPFRTNFVVGRSAEHCHIVIPDQRISRKHAELSYFPEKGLCVCDLRSTNGTFLNGRKLGETHKILESGSMIGLGELMLTVSRSR